MVLVPILHCPDFDTILRLDLVIETFRANRYLRQKNKLLNLYHKLFQIL